MQMLKSEAVSILSTKADIESKTHCCLNSFQSTLSLSLPPTESISCIASANLRDADSVRQNLRYAKRLRCSPYSWLNGALPPIICVTMRSYNASSLDNNFSNLKSL